MESEYMLFMDEKDSENFEAEHNLFGDGIIDESTKNKIEDSAFKWPHEAVLLLIDEYEKRQHDFISGKISQKKLWIKISDQLQAYDHNNKSGNSAKNWPYTTLMDDLMKDKPSIAPVSTCTSTGKKRTLLESSGESSTSYSDNLAIRKKEKITPANQILSKLEERSIKNEENKERRFKEFMAFTARK
ncbi:hypothetical protein PV326_001597, partial [Microctonus aethiopoides]